MKKSCFRDTLRMNSGYFKMVSVCIHDAVEMLHECFKDATNAASMMHIYMTFFSMLQLCIKETSRYIKGFEECIIYALVWIGRITFNLLRNHWSYTLFISPFRALTYSV